MPGGPSERVPEAPRDDGTRFCGVRRGAAAGGVSGLLVRREVAAVGSCPAASDRDVRRSGGGAAPAGDLPGRLRPVACAAAGPAAVEAEVRGCGDLRGAGAARGQRIARDPLAALEAVTAGLRRGFAGLATVAAHEVAAHLTGGMLLAPPVPGLAGNTTLAAMAAVSPS